MNSLPQISVYSELGFDYRLRLWNCLSLNTVPKRLFIKWINTGLLGSGYVNTIGRRTYKILKYIMQLYLQVDIHRGYNTLREKIQYDR